MLYNKSPEKDAAAYTRTAMDSPVTVEMLSSRAAVSAQPCGCAAAEHADLLWMTICHRQECNCTGVMFAERLHAAQLPRPATAVGSYIFWHAAVCARMFTCIHTAIKIDAPA